MTKRSQLLELKKKLDSLQTEDISSKFKNSLIAQEIENITNQLNQNPTIETLQRFNDQLNELTLKIGKVQDQSEQENKKIREDLAPVPVDFTPIEESIQKVQEELKQELGQGDTNVLAEVENRIRQIPQTPDLTQEVINLREELNKRIDSIPKDDDSALQAEVDNLRQQVQDFIVADNEEDKKDKEQLNQTILKLRQEIMNRLANLGGGNANRNIAISGNTSVLSRYTDINIKPGANVTLSYSNNNTTKYLDLTIAATGGSGSGITRQIQTTTISSVIATIASTDQVTLANGGVQITLPSAVGDTNLYTIKNVGNSSVLVATVSAQTIDGQSNIIMPIQYTSVDLISNGSNWEIT